MDIQEKRIKEHTELVKDFAICKLESIKNWLADKYEIALAYNQFNQTDPHALEEFKEENETAEGTKERARVAYKLMHYEFDNMAKYYGEYPAFNFLEYNTTLVLVVRNGSKEEYISTEHDASYGDFQRTINEMQERIKKIEKI